MQRINRKIAALLFGFSSALFPVACITGKDRTTPDNRPIPSNSIMGLKTYEYLCEPLLTKNHKDLEKLLDRYGREGWELAGFVDTQGQSYAFCLKR